MKTHSCNSPANRRNRENENWDLDWGLTLSSTQCGSVRSVGGVSRRRQDQGACFPFKEAALHCNCCYKICDVMTDASRCCYPTDWGKQKMSENGTGNS